MARNLHLSQILEGTQYPKLVLALSVILLLVLELSIYIVVSSQSGLKSTVVIADVNGTKIYETPGTVLTAYEKMVFESSFGSLQNYKMHVESESVPFPYRSWILLAIGIPMGLILLLYFLVRVWLILLNEDHADKACDASSTQGKARLVSFLSASRHISVLHVGFVVVLAVLSLWLIPSFLGDIIGSCVAAVREYQLFFLGFSVFAGGFLIWIVYLRYKLSKRMLDNQMEIEKYRIQTNLLAQNPDLQQLEHVGGEADKQPVQLLETRDS
jgi:hypothetical protein